MSYAPTVGINKDGADLYVIDERTGRRTEVIDDQLENDVHALLDGDDPPTGRWVNSEALGERLIAVPVYYDDRPLADLAALMEHRDLAGFEQVRLGDLREMHWIDCLNGHGSPSADLRHGTVPYIKVSDLRAGQVNVNPTNRVSDVVARRYWRGDHSGLRTYDLLTPVRSSKNIGEFSVLMPGQEQVVLTKEILVVRAAEAAPFDNFYLLWALTLKAVRQQWNRLIFMQTNREDVGKRYNDIVLPVPPNRRTADQVSEPFRRYYEGVHELRSALVEYLDADDRHYVFITPTVALDEPDDVEGPVS